MATVSKNRREWSDKFERDDRQPAIDAVNEQEPARSLHGQLVRVESGSIRRLSYKVNEMRRFRNPSPPSPPPPRRRSTSDNRAAIHKMGRRGRPEDSSASAYRYSHERDGAGRRSGDDNSTNKKRGSSRTSQDINAKHQGQGEGPS